MSITSNFGRVIEYQRSDVFLEERDVSGVPLPPGVGAGGPSNVSPTLLEIIDAPMLGPSNDTNAFTIYFSVQKAINQLWVGAQIHLSLDSGLTYDPVATPTQESTCGQAISVLGSGPVGIPDVDNYVDIQLDNLSATLFGLTEAQWLNRVGAFLLGGNGRWELISYRYSTSLGSGVFRLSGLLRGLNGTEDAVGEHAMNDRFYLVQGLVKTIRPNAEIGTNYTFRAVSIGQDFNEAGDINQVVDGVSLRPFSPCNFSSVRDAGTLDWTTMFYPRGRTRPNVNFWYQVPISDIPEEYEIDLLDGPMGNVVATRTVSSRPWIYTQAQQVTDFGSTQSELYFNAYAIHPDYGRGRAAYVELPNDQ